MKEVYDSCTTRLHVLAAMLAVSLQTFAHIDEIKRDFGPPQGQVLNAIRDFKHEPVTDRTRSDMLSQKQRRFYYAEAFGPLLPVEDWKSITWLVEGTWVHRPETATNLCDSCRSTSAVLLSVHRWKANQEALCPVCGVASTFIPKRFAKMRMRHRVVTYSRKDDETKLLKIPRYANKCLAVVDTWDKLVSSGEWDEELRRKSMRDADRERSHDINYDFGRVAGTYRMGRRACSPVPGGTGSFDCLGTKSNKSSLIFTKILFPMR